MKKKVWFGTSIKNVEIPDDCPLNDNIIRQHIDQSHRIDRMEIGNKHASELILEISDNGYPRILSLLCEKHRLVGLLRQILRDLEDDSQ